MLTKLHLIEPTSILTVQRINLNYFSIFYNVLSLLCEGLMHKQKKYCFKKSEIYRKRLLNPRNFQEIWATKITIAGSYNHSGP